MKFTKQILISAVLVFIGLSAQAQVGFDVYGGGRTLFTVPLSITATTSNQIVDIHGWEGIMKADLICCTNSGASVTTVQLLHSSDKTNWSAITYSLATSNNVITTNLYYGTGTPLATNFYQFAGTVTTPVVSNGFLTTYILPAPFTNTGAQTINNGVVEMGFNVADVQRYIQVVWTMTSVTTATNSVEAIFTGRKQQQ